ncbi:MAG: ComEC/Rec2 family competence protein, partial [Chitinophagaceae bacterium]
MIPFIAGILLGFHHALPLIISGSIILFLLIFTAYIQYGTNANNQYQWKNYNALILSLCLLLLAWTYTWDSQSIHQRTHFSKVQKSKQTEIEITEILNTKGDYQKLYATVTSLIDSSGCRHSVTGKILVYLWIDSTKTLLPGDRFLVSGLVSPINGPANQDDFDYQYYLSTKDIHHKLYVKQNQYLAVSNNPTTLYSLAYQFKSACNKRLKANITRKENYGVAEALLLGYKYDIDNNTNQIFARTGTLHVLAVSGMHVGLIYGLLTWVCGAFLRFRLGKYFKFGIIISGIWMYAFITGMGASILRAVVMFSFISLAQISGRKTHTFNLLAASACVLFLYDPLCLFDPGFQLSYSAVAGIILIYPLFKKYCYSKYKILKYIKELLALTLSAQVFTLPFSIFYFGQFPNLFLIANLLIIPLTTILIFSLIVLVILPYGKISMLVGIWIEKGLDLNFNIAEYISNNKFSVTNELYISLTEAGLMIILAGLITLYFYLKSVKTILAACAVIIVISGIRTERSITSKLQNEILVYHGLKNQYYVCLNGNEALIIGEENRFEKDLFLQQSLKKYFARKK